MCGNSLFLVLEPLFSVKFSFRLSQDQMFRDLLSGGLYYVLPTLHKITQQHRAPNKCPVIDLVGLCLNYSMGSNKDLIALFLNIT